MDAETNLIRQAVRVSIPRYTLGIDIETKNVTANSYILAIGAVLFDNYTLKTQACLNLEFDPNDPEQANRTEANFTLDWWHTRGEEPKFPSQAAYDRTWSGTLKFLAGMELFDKFMRQLPRDGDIVLPMRGPDFDYVILKDALRDAGIYRTPMYARALDSHRTIERVLEALEIPPVSEAEHKNMVWKGEPIPHVAIYDAAIEGYETARMYHLLHCIKTIGYDETIARIKSWEDSKACETISLLTAENNE